MPTTWAAAIVLGGVVRGQPGPGSTAPLSIGAVGMVAGGRVGQLDVADRAGGLLDLGRDTGRALAADWPPLAGHVLPPAVGPVGRAAAPIRYLVKLSVVPESSERWNVWIVGGRQRRGRVQLGDRRVVPLGDLAVEDLARASGRPAPGCRHRARCRRSRSGRRPSAGRSPWPPLQTVLDGVDLGGLERPSRSRRRRSVPWVNVGDAGAGADAVVVDLGAPSRTACSS